VSVIYNWDTFVNRIAECCKLFTRHAPRMHAHNRPRLPELAYLALHDPKIQKNISNNAMKNISKSVLTAKTPVSLFSISRHFSNKNCGCTLIVCKQLKMVQGLLVVYNRFTTRHTPWPWWLEAQFCGNCVSNLKVYIYYILNLSLGLYTSLRLITHCKQSVNINLCCMASYRLCSPLTFCQLFIFLPTFAQDF